MQGNFQELGGEVAMTKTDLLCSPGQVERPEAWRNAGNGNSVPVLRALTLADYTEPTHVVRDLYLTEKRRGDM